jgi:hypothetical protein
MYSLDCSYFEEEFNTLDELIYYVEQVGMDPNYEIIRDGKLTGETAFKAEKIRPWGGAPGKCAQ